MQFSVRIQNNLDLRQASNEIKTPSQFLEKVKRIRRTSFYEAIASGNDATGKRVKPLSPAYARIKRRKYGRRAIRVATGKMQASYKSRVTNNQLIETVDDDKAIFHQRGTNIMPQRKLLPDSWADLPRAEKKLIERAGSDYIENIIDKIATRSRPF